MMSLHLSRRSFCVAAGVTGTVSVSQWTGVALASKANTLNLGIQMYSLRGYKVDEALQHAKDLGFKYIEFYGGMFPTDSDASAIAAMRKKVSDLGLTMTAHGVNHFLGRGHLDVLGVFAALKQVNFPINGALSLEYEENPNNPLDDIRQCVQVANDALAKT